MARSMARVASADAARTRGRRLLFVGLLGSLLTIVMAYAGAACGLSGCSPAATTTGITIAVTVGNGLCALAASQPAEPAWEIVVCKIEGGIATVLQPAGTLAAAKASPPSTKGP